MSKSEAGVNIWRDTWQFFVSVKLTVFLLLTLATTSIIGTLIPQNQSQAEYVKAFGPFWYRVYSVLDLFDMYHSWWFQLLLITLTANIVICSIDRFSATRKIIFPGTPKFNVGRFRKLSQKETFDSDESAETLLERYASALSKGFSYQRSEVTDRGQCLFAEKWRQARLGVYVVHFSVVLLLLGSLIGSLFGFEGYVNIGEGESSRVIRLRNKPATLALDFEIRCDDFDVSFYDTGAPKEFRSSLTILEDGREAVKKDIIVNDPLRYKGVNIFQSSYGEIPGNTVILSFTERKSGRTYTHKTALGQPLALNDTHGTLVLSAYNPTAKFRGHPVGPAFTATLTPVQGEAIELLLPLRFPTFDRMRKGDLVVAIKDIEQRYYTGLQVTNDPGVWVVYSGFILMLLGCYITFFMSHQQVCVELVHKGNGTRVIVSGTSAKNKFGMQQRVKRISEGLKQHKTLP